MEFPAVFGISLFSIEVIALSNGLYEHAVNAQGLKNFVFYYQKKCFSCAVFYLTTKTYELIA